MPRPSFFRPLLFVSSRVDDAIARSETVAAQLERLNHVEYNEIAEQLQTALDELKSAQDAVAKLRELEKKVRTAK
ncbi:hypothetical protein [Sulfitobacter sp. R18_1]|uniref:hypothetical protein n=1 Tax=Sulfitobacter sp. R18_1 TaxID=2821104 RepID=UPI001AD974A1|nr:hypothetical protein [Sulfitobacter sp. R18_1]MBO9427991.1 hypothetical protein [Sulfitobacter sp. R18_1]